ncbi:hypothetical protein JCGZ_16305 [Jatropha curcas]|uniref:Peroxisomal membrane protein n=1 Tax=Jatropha curcas TaxID=180498 RepID=A0A067L7S6_JATCU|nr:PXMP2/4 family protein 4 [Jatropha curcas]XP_012093096.1 PXMP2/4 family protein 4 [Jatropha curcas]KDP44472.1 hypothetical protein JCGZ_16305 [Jatropha curcas]
MSASFLRKSSIHRLLRSHTITDIAGVDPTTTAATAIHSIFKHQTTQSRAFFRFSQIFRKTREYNDLSPSFFTSALSSGSSSSNVTASFVGWYLAMVKSRPILTKSVTSSLIYVAADLSSQTIVKPDSETYDLVRTLRMAGYGMVILGPSLHFWFNFVSKQFPKRDLITTFKKIILGQTLYGPAMTVLFFSLNARLQGENNQEIVARLNRDLLPTMMNGVMYWPVCDFITFKFIPVHLQPLVSNSFSYLWTVYMTYMASLEKANT